MPVTLRQIRGTAAGEGSGVPTAVCEGIIATAVLALSLLILSGSGREAAASESVQADLSEQQTPAHNLWGRCHHGTMRCNVESTKAA